MIFRYAPVNNDISDILHKAETYVDLNGNHPSKEKGLNPHQIKPEIRQSNLFGGEWTLTVKDPILREKMQQQIYTQQAYKQYIFIYS